MLIETLMVRYPPLPSLASVMVVLTFILENFTEKDLDNITLAITHPSFSCQSREAVWWNVEDQRIGWLDNFASILQILTPLLKIEL